MSDRSQEPPKKKQKMTQPTTPMKQEEVRAMLDALMEADRSLASPLPVVLLNSVTTKCGRKTLIQHMIKSSDALKIAFLLSPACSSKMNVAKSSKVFSVNNIQEAIDVMLKQVAVPQCQFDCFVVDVNTAEDFETTFTYFEEQLWREQNAEDYICPIYLDTVISVVNTPFLAKHLQNISRFDIHQEERLCFSLEVSNVILLNFADQVDDKIIDDLVSKIGYLATVENCRVFETSFCEIDLFHLMGSRLAEPDNYDGLLEICREAKQKFTSALAIENDMKITATKKPTAPSNKKSAVVETSTIGKHKNAQIVASLLSLKDPTKKHLSVVTRSSEKLASIEHFLENVIYEYHKFPTIAGARIPLEDLGSYLEESIRQNLMMIFYNEGEEGEEEEGNEENEDAEGDEDMAEESDKAEEEEENEDDEDDEGDGAYMQKLRMDPYFFLSLHAQALESFIQDIVQCANLYMKLFRQKAVNIKIEMSDNNGKVCEDSGRALLVSYLGGGFQWSSADVKDQVLTIPKYAVSVRSKPSHFEFEDIAKSPHGLRLVVTMH